MFDEVVERVYAALKMSADLVSDPTLVVRSMSEGADGLRRSLSMAETAVLSWGTADPAERTQARRVVNELRAARLDLQTYELDRHRACVSTLRTCLHRMRTAASVDDLAARVPHDVAALGFGRALFSWVDQARWVPVSFYTVAGPEEARAVMEAGSPPYWHTRDLLEAEMIRHRRSMMVHDALAHPRVHQDIQAVMQSRSYVAAPVVRDTSVIAFVHADQGVEAGEVSEFDREVLSSFAEGLGLAIDRLAAMDELARLREGASRRAEVLRDLAADLDGTVALALPADRLLIAQPDPTWADGLTRREHQVLHLLSEGRSNAEIAERLYITESTAKTHVKHVLRKLGAANRAQAGALYRGAGSGG